MIRIVCLFFLLIFMCSCGSSVSTTATDQKSKAIDSSISVENEYKVAKPHSAIQKAQILGAWTDGKYENATFDIQQDSIFYTDEMVSYPYTLKGDSITIRYLDVSFMGVIYFIKDTLVLSDPEFGTTKYYRYKD
jgi:hypothetical protein